MKKEYEVPRAEKLEFNYSEGVVASNGCGGIYQEYKDGFKGCRETPTGNWVYPYADIK